MTDGLRRGLGGSRRREELRMASTETDDGVHVLDGNMPFGVSVTGYDTYDSYAYPGGLNQTVINPIE